MSIKQKIKQLEEYYNSFPDWYWKHGLHDAEILSIEVVEDFDEGQSKKEKYKSIEIFLDSEGAVYESDIESVIFCDCIILSTDIAISEFNDYLAENKLWWLSDIVEKTEYGYKLDICFVGEGGSERNISMRLSSATIMRKK